MEKQEKKEKVIFPKKVYSPKFRKYGFKWNENDKEWIVPPAYDEAGDAWRGLRVWIKKGNKYGLLNLESGQEEIPCEYGFPPYLSKEGLAILWKDHKAGVVNLRNEVIIPFIYDYLVRRFRAPEEGFVGSIGDGELICMNIKGERSEFSEEELERISYDWMEKEYPDYVQKTVDEIEEEIKELHQEWSVNKDDELKERIDQLLTIRARRLNKKWKHTPENAKRIDRVNTLLMRAVKRAMTLGKRTAQSLDWMRRTRNDFYSVCVFVYPFWDNRYSEWKDTPIEKASRKVLDDEECNQSPHHIWNIIVDMGSCFREDNKGVCFVHSASSSDPEDWDWTSAVMDDGQSWDEGIHFPVYQDVYFLYPWHLLYWETYDFALEDLARLNDFRVEVKVSFEVKVKDKPIK